MTLESQAVAHAAKHAGINLGFYVLVCVVIAVAYVAWDTRGFSKPPSWFVVRQELGYAPSSTE